jgi:hypothetical protein
MRNEQGQLMFVPALQQPSSQPNSTPGQRIQYVRVSIDMMVSLFAERFLNHISVTTVFAIKICSV